MSLIQRVYLGLTCSALCVSISGFVDDSSSPSAPIAPFGAVGQDAVPDLNLETRLVAGTEEKVQYGSLTVYENRSAGKGRLLELTVVVVPARSPDPAPDPIFILEGGPGLAAADHFRRHLNSWMRRDRDIVLINQRGTGGTNRLDCELPGSNENLQGYLDPIFNPEVLRSCLKSLQNEVDLTQYTTPAAMDDLDDLRAALGYNQINLVGGSYGTRAALIYMRRHPAHVRSAILNGVAPVAFTNPLYHARAAQQALDLIMAECAADPDCAKKYPNLSQQFAAVMDQLETQPVPATITNPTTGEKVVVRLTREAFADALRIIMYSNSREVPFFIHRAFLGDFDLFAQRGFTSERRIRDMIAVGMLLCVTCNEDIPRIDPDMIPELTKNTFLGEGRVRRQMAICDFWPRIKLPNYGDPVQCAAPVLLLSGTLDPVTPPRWGENAAENLPNSIHVIAPGSHGVGGPCIQTIMEQFLKKGSSEGIDTSCVETMRLPSFR